MEFYFNDLFIEKDASFSSDDSLLSSGISDDDGLVENEDNQKEGLRMLEWNEDVKAGPEEGQIKTEQMKESRSLKQERNTRYGLIFCFEGNHSASFSWNQKNRWMYCEKNSLEIAL